MTRRRTARRLRVVRWHLLCGRCPLCRRWLDPDDPPGTWGYWCPPCQLGWWMTQWGDVLLLHQAGHLLPPVRQPTVLTQQRWERTCQAVARALWAWRQQTRERTVCHTS